nr:SSI family serine proteinase inhibitor [uncultured Actinoplanes sp.]
MFRLVTVMMAVLGSPAFLPGGPALAEIHRLADPRGGEGRGYGPAGQLTLSYLADAGFAAAVKLTCSPDGGGHPDAGAACRTLTRYDADPDRMTPAPTACILLWSPVTAQIQGTWHGAEVSWTHRYGNSCEMRRATGVLFTF